MEEGACVASRINNTLILKDGTDTSRPHEDRINI